MCISIYSISGLLRWFLHVFLLFLHWSVCWFQTVLSRHSSDWLTCWFWCPTYKLSNQRIALPSFTVLLFLPQMRKLLIPFWLPCYSPICQKSHLGSFINLSSPSILTPPWGLSSQSIWDILWPLLSSSHHTKGNITIGLDYHQDLLKSIALPVFILHFSIDKLVLLLSA